MIDIITTLVHIQFSDSFKVTVMTTRQLFKSNRLQAGQFDYTLRKQTGGPGQYARVIGRLEACDELFVFENRVMGGTLPQDYIKACEQGFRDATGSGILAGYPVVGVKVILEGGDFHPIDSSDRSFRFAACQAFYQGMSTADAVIIEPIMDVVVLVPNEFIGSLQGDLMSRRGVLQDMSTNDDGTELRVQVPLSELFGYATQLRSLTSGKGNFSMTPSDYQPVPDRVQELLIAKA
jgi:elongation factor G